MQRIRPTFRRGFTLIEALAAIAVMMVVIPVVLEGFILANDIAMNARQMADATALAQGQMERIIATGDWQNGSSNGEETVQNVRYQWDALLSDFGAEQNVQTLTLTVRWERRTTERSVQLTTIVYIPGSTVSTTGTPLLGGGLP